MGLDEVKTAKTIALITAAVAILVILGWFFDVQILRTVIPGVIAMRFLTAICFLSCSVLIYCLAKIKEEHPISTASIVIIILSSLFISLLMLISFFNVLGVQFNLEEMINYNYVDHAKTFPVSVPSISTMLCFLLIAFVGFISIFCSSCSKKAVKKIGFIISAISLLVLLGYLLGIPFLYFALEGISNAMAIHTGILFLLIGISFILLGRKDGHHSFTQSYSVKQKLAIGFSLILGLIIIMASISTIILAENNKYLRLIKEVEGPLQVMAEQVIGYDAMLTSNAEAVVLHSMKGETDEIALHKSWYSRQGEELDRLLKTEAPVLLEKSQRGTEDKEKIKSYLIELDKVNLALVDLETEAFSAVEKGNTDEAYSFIAGKQYQDYKTVLRNLYNKWAAEEARISNTFKQKNLNNLQYVFWSNLILSALILLIGIILAWKIVSSIVGPLTKLGNAAKELSSGNIDVKIPHEVKVMPGVIGDIAIAYDRLIESSHMALEKFVESKISGKYRKFFEDAVDAIFIADIETRKLVDCNKEAEKLTGYSKKEILSMKADELHPRDVLKETMLGFKKQAEGKIKKVFTEILTKDKKRVKVAINASKVRIGSKYYNQGIFRNLNGKESSKKEELNVKAG